MARERGFLAGITAFLKRHGQCRGGYSFVQGKSAKDIYMVCADGTRYELCDLSNKFLLKTRVVPKDILRL